MASKQQDFKPGDIFFLTKARVLAQKDCPRGEPPDGTTLWAVSGPPTGEWMRIETFKGQVRPRKLTKGAV